VLEATRYLIRPNLTLVNNTDRRLTALSLEFENTDGVALSYFERLSSQIEPHASFTLNNRAGTSDGDPASFVVKVAGAMFEDGISWGDVLPPPPPPPPPPAPAEIPRSGVEVIRKSGGVLQNSVISRVEPNYPPLAKAARLAARSRSRSARRYRGNVTSASCQRTSAPQDAAVTAAREWRFSPTRAERRSK
jgi:hypothetical protein